MHVKQQSNNINFPHLNGVRNFVSQHISKTIFEENFSAWYSILFSGSRDSHDICNWVVNNMKFWEPLS